MTDDSSRPSGPPPTSAPAGTPATKQRTVSVGQILGGILFILIVIFIVENTDDVKIRIIAGPKVTTPVFVALLIAAVVGALISALLRYRRKQHARNR